MTFHLDFKRKRFAVGPYVRIGNLTVVRLWRWDYVRCGSQWHIVRHVR